MNSMKMMNLKFSLICIFMSFFICLVAQDSIKSSIIEEKNGYVVIEPESIKSFGSWKLHNDNKEFSWLSGFTGSGCLQFTGNAETSGPPKNIITFPIKINNAGEYYLKIRGIEAPLETKEGDKANDCYVAMLGQDGCYGKLNKHVLLGASYNWLWSIRAECEKHKFSDPKYKLEKGIHELQIAGRSKNFFIDRIVLYKKSDSFTERHATSSSLTMDNIPDFEKTLCKPEIVMNAVDFKNKRAGEVPITVQRKYNCLQIPANIVRFRDKFAAVEDAFPGEDGKYNVVLTSLVERDGECTYRVLINGKLIGEYQNPESDSDYEPYLKMWKNISIKKDDIIRVESNTHTNKKIPEKDGTAWARGRWTKIEFCKN